MLFYRLLDIAIGIFLIGTLYHIYKWLTVNTGPEKAPFGAWARIQGVLAGLLGLLTRAKIIKALRIFLLDAILQVKVAREDFLRWLMHGLIFFGFLGLFLMHALEGPVTQSLFPDYQSTLNPFLFLRNLMGIMVLAGVAIAIVRRATMPGLRKTTNRRDVVAITILFVIIFSGFALESLQIISEPMFDEMVLDYMGTDDPDEVMPLKAYWAENFGVVFDEPPMEVNEELLEEGFALHEESCMVCHSRPVSAFGSYSFAKLLTPAASFFNGLRMDIILWYIHFVACFAGLAYLPFSRFFHLIASPISLIATGIAVDEENDTAAKAMRRALALDACTHCGTCSVRCSVGPVFQLMGNPAIIPSEKLLLTHKLARKKAWDEAGLAALGEGSFICTDCYRCTTVCPAGIDLQDLWFAARKKLAERGYPSIFARMRQQNVPGACGVENQAAHYPTAMGDLYTRTIPWLTGTSFAACFECQTQPMIIRVRRSDCCPIRSCMPWGWD